ncbi:MAG: Protein-glutamine gamma-glutamyltransferase [candidate division BRC1 bacterium ADurb.BinA364]|nr:MAG: Protein-glutamine gamma-glutamyltransferase [candidate division BRC1 bacterium ADurb.BinA364]
MLALDAPGALPADLALESTLTASSRVPITQRQRFSLTAILDFSFNRDEDQAALRRNLALPANANPRARALAESWRQADPDPQRLVQKALSLFSGAGFSYTLQPPLLGAHPVDDFLFVTQRGFCEHYASAFVVLMRAAGVPARVVTGYQGGEANPIDGFVVIRQSDAHAWAEVWLAGRGWTRIDPTAAVAPTRVESGIVAALPAGEPLPALIQLRSDWLRTLQFRWEAINNARNQYVLGYNPQRQREFLSRLGLSDPDWTHSNTVCVLGDTPAARDRRFKPGNVMVSHRNLDTAIVIERETGEIVWAWGPGTLSRQHATILLPNGHMLCFDNGTARKWSAVWELEPIERAIVWSYKGTPPESFFASALSNAQRLPNGNTFICSGSKPDHGRLFEVTPEGEIVWEYQNHYAAYAQGEKIVYRAYKYPPETIEPFLNK